MDEHAVLSPKNCQELDQWLKANIDTIEFPIWVEIYKKSSGKQTLSYDKIVEEAICWG